MAELSTNLWTAARETREALLIKIATLPLAGTWHSYQRDAPNMNAYKKLFDFRDTRDQKTKLRGGYLMSRHFAPDTASESTSCTPARILIYARFLMQIEDEFMRARTPLAGTNSSDEFEELQARFFTAINHDNGLGFTNLEVAMPEPVQDAQLDYTDGWLGHNATYAIEATLYTD